MLERTDIRSTFLISATRNLTNQFLYGAQWYLIKYFPIREVPIDLRLVSYTKIHENNFDGLLLAKKEFVPTRIAQMPLRGSGSKHVKSSYRAPFTTLSDTPVIRGYSCYVNIV